MKPKNLDRFGDVKEIEVIFIFFLIVSIILSGFVGYSIGIKETNNDNFIPEIPDEIFSVSGVIGEINSDSIKIENVNVNVNSETEITKIGSEESVSFNILKTGDLIIAESDENVKDKTEFTAMRIMIVSQ